MYFFYSLKMPFCAKVVGESQVSWGSLPEKGWTAVVKGTKAEV